MSLSAQIVSDLHAAQKDLSAGSKYRLGVLRLLSAALKNEEIALKARTQGLTDEQVLTIIRKEVKKRKETAKLYRTHGEEVRARAEDEEFSILSQYLPAALGAEEIRAEVRAVVASCPEELRSIGALMKAVMTKFNGTVDGQQVRTIVEEEIARTG